MRQSLVTLFPCFHPDHVAYRWAVLVTVMLSTFMVILDGTIVNIAIPSIMASFGVTLGEVVWVSTAYLIALSVILAVSGWLADHFGAKEVYLIGLFIFTLSSYFCGISWDLHTLIFFRIVQGIGGGILLPVGMRLFTNEFPPEKRITALGFYSISVAAAVSLGPTVGGYLLQYLGWGWIFFINVPVGILTLFAAWVIFKSFPRKKIEFFDIWGLLFLTAFIITLLVGISSGNAAWNAEGWTSRFTLTSFLISGASLVGFLWVELSISHPIVDLGVFKDRNFLLGNLVLFIFSFTLFGSSFLLPLYLQNGLEYSKIQTGLVLLPIGLMQGLIGPLTGWLGKYIPPRYLVTAGILCLGISYQFNAHFTLYTETPSMYLLFAFRGFACALMFAPLVSLTLSTTSEEKMAQATGLFTVQRQIGAALGVAIFETIFINRQMYHEAMYSRMISPSSPAFGETSRALAYTVKSFYSPGSPEVFAQARQLILENMGKQVFIQAINDNLLIAGVITFFSCIPLFFLKKAS